MVCAISSILTPLDMADDSVVHAIERSSVVPGHPSSRLHGCPCGRSVGHITGLMINDSVGCAMHHTAHDK